MGPSGTLQMTKPSPKLGRAGNRAFSIKGSQLQKNLPVEIRQIQSDHLQDTLTPSSPPLVILTALTPHLPKQRPHSTQKPTAKYQIIQMGWEPMEGQEQGPPVQTASSGPQL